MTADRIAVTPEMAGAGVLVLPFGIESVLGEMTEHALVSLVYRAMESARVAENVSITPEMIAAGASVLYRMETASAREEYWAEEVFRAMAEEK